MNDIKMMYTENPLLDEIVYACKIMMTDCILKDQELADSFETVESVKKSDIYAAIIEGRAKFEYFTYDEAMLRENTNMSDDLIKSCVLDNKKIPEVVRPYLVKVASEKFLSTYSEENDYYRTLAGLPRMTEKQIFITEEDIKNITIDIDISKPLHLMNQSELTALESAGVLDRIKREFFPSYKYIDFLGKRRTDPYIARKIDKFGLIFVANPGNNILYNRFIELINKNKEYVVRTMYFEAYKYGSDNFDKFIIVMIILQTVIDMITEMPEYYIRRDIFDIRTIQYFFESAGVEYFPEIPLKYQIAMVRNLNRLIKYSATNKVIVDIASLFGFDNIEIFAYYMLKYRITDSNGDYVFNTKKDPNDESKLIPDNSKNYDLKFIKVPIEDVVDDYIKDKNNHYDYSSITGNDKYWNGPYAKSLVKQKILEEEFNIVRTKYLSVDAVVELTDITFELPYFVNMIMFNNVFKSELNISIPYLSSSDPINLVDLFIYLYALMYMYYGLEDSIIDTPTKYLSIKGFNFEANMNEISQHLLDKGYTLEELGVSNFKIPKNGILTFNQLVEIYTNNKNVYTHIVDQMLNASSKKIYDIYKYLYNALMITNANYDYYYINDKGRIAKTYTEFLMYNSSVLYESLTNISSDMDKDSREIKINNEINNVTGFIVQYLDSDELNNIFSNMPTLSTDYLKSYMFKVINFFKSYKIDLTSVSNIYKFADKLENKIIILDDINVGRYYEWKNIYNLVELMSLDVQYTAKDITKIDELIKLLGYKNKKITRNDLYSILDSSAINVLSRYSDKFSIADPVSYDVNTTDEDHVNIHDGINSMASSFNLIDSINIDDDVYIRRY